MAFERNADGHIRITGSDIEVYRLKCLVVALKVHIESNGKVRVTKDDYMKFARKIGYVGRTAKALLADIISKNPGIR